VGGGVMVFVIVIDSCCDSVRDRVRSSLDDRDIDFWKLGDGVGAWVSVITAVGDSEMDGLE